MKLTVLGWQGPTPGPGGACSGYLLQGENGEAIALDMGSGSLARLMRRIAPPALGAIVLSHLHWDHISDMLPLSYLPGALSVPVYAPGAPAFAREALESAGWRLLPQEPFSLGSFRVRFLPGRHPVPSCCVRVEGEGKTFVYTGDTNTLPALAQFAKGADLLLADACLTEANWAEDKPHLSPRLCAELAAQAGVKRLCLSHVSPTGDAQTMLSEAEPHFPGAVVAHDGLTIAF